VIAAPCIKITLDNGMWMKEQGNYSGNKNVGNSSSKWAIILKHHVEVREPLSHTKPLLSKY